MDVVRPKVSVNVITRLALPDEVGVPAMVAASRDSPSRRWPSVIDHVPER
jgi:hypothetical protein